MKTPFMQQDAELLKEFGKVTTLDKNVIEIKWFNILGFTRDSFTTILLAVRENDISWIWSGANLYVIPAIIFSKIFRKKVVVNVGGWEVEPDNGQASFWRGALVRWILRNADAAIVPSGIYREITLKVEPATKGICLIPNYIDTSLCDLPLPEKKELVVTTYCSVGMEKRKGLDTFRAVSKTGLPFTFEIHKRLPRILYISLLSRAKVYCLLSDREPFGISIVEAMALGCVPVISDRGALPGLVAGTGVVVPYGDIGATREGITRAMAMSGDRARERARYFSKERKKHHVEMLLSKLMEMKE